MKMQGFTNFVLLKFLIVMLPLYGCVSNITTTNKPNLRIVTSEIDLWINKMPGVDNKQPIIHLNGRIVIRNIGKVKVENLILRYIRVSQDKLSVGIEPVNLLSSGNPNNIMPNDENTMTFKYSKLIPGNIFNYDSTVTLILDFSAAGTSFSDSLKNQIIKKVY